MVICCEPPSAPRHRVVATAAHRTHSGAHNSLVRRCCCTSRHVQSICRLGRCLWAKFDSAWANHFAASALGGSFIFCNPHSWQVQTRIPVVARPSGLTFRSRRAATPPLNSSVGWHVWPIEKSTFFLTFRCQPISRQLSAIGPSFALELITRLISQRLRRLWRFASLSRLRSPPMSLLSAVAMVGFLIKSWVRFCTLLARTVTISWWIVSLSLPFATQLQRQTSCQASRKPNSKKPSGHP